MKIHILYRQYFDGLGKERKLGGVETYIDALCVLFKKKGITPVICQYAKTTFTKECNGTLVRGFPVDNAKALFACIEKDIDKANDLVLFGTDAISYKLEGVRTMSIQHGVGWDIPYTERSLFRNGIGRIRYSWYGLRDFLYCDSSVCVDYNFYNWYKAIYPNADRKKICVIPNFANRIISDEQLNEKIAGFGKKPIKIIFARRFEFFRGSILFAKVMANVLKRHDNIELTIAGEGPCEKDIRDILSSYVDRVTITKYLPSEAFDIHKQHDIAVVPTIGSEGTSLSLIEAMAAGCVAVATPVGGMSNVILDGYNGLFTMPEQKELEEVIEKAIKIIESGDGQMVKRSVETIRTSFSLETWEQKWSKFIDELIENK